MFRCLGWGGGGGGSMELFFGFFCRFFFFFFFRSLISIYIYIYIYMKKATCPVLLRRSSSLIFFFWGTKKFDRINPVCISDSLKDIYIYIFCAMDCEFLSGQRYFRRTDFDELHRCPGG